MCKFIKAKYTQLKAFLKKNLGWVIGIISSFVLGATAVLSFGTPAYRESKRSLKRLEEQLAEYSRLNARLREANNNLALRLESIYTGHTELKEYHERITATTERTERGLQESQAVIDELGQRLERNTDNIEELESITERLRVESKRINAGIEYLEGWFQRLESTDSTT